MADLGLGHAGKARIAYFGRAVKGYESWETLGKEAEKSRVSSCVSVADQTLNNSWPSIFCACAQLATPT